jgi:glycosyltransferase involved in cell wall biosynthesis/polysaccharide pyruvyl transferase WcaK-like protein
LRVPTLWRQAGGLGAVQGGVAALACTDVLLAGLLAGGDPAAAGYQVAALLGRVPLFLAGALSMAVFPRLASPTGSPARTVRSAITTFATLAIPTVVVVATLPPSLVAAAFPDGYPNVAALVPFTAVAGGMIGLVNLLTTFYQAQRRFAACLRRLAAGLVGTAAAAALGLATAGVSGLAVGTLAGTGATALLLTLGVRRIWTDALPPGRGLVAAGLAVLPLAVLRPQPLLWAPAALALVTAAGYVGLLRPGPPRASAYAAPAGAPATRPRVLHLAFEDHRRPGSGGGAVRTREINHRLAREYDITVVTARYPGCRPRVEDGVRYVHVGASLGYFGSILAYFAALPFALWRHRSDLVVEDFAAPFGGALVPWLTRRPVVGCVQWLFAREKSRQYKLPFFLVETLAVRSHRRLVAVSADLAAQLRAGNRRARVDVVHNGVDPIAFEARSGRRSDIVFLGRVEIAQKGLDALLDAFAAVASTTDADLLIVGDGPDVAEVRALARRLGIDGRVRFLGRVDGRAKFDLLASARVVAMPSRYETFGMVAAEAMATATPVVAFDIPCLREVLPPDCGRLVPAGDVPAFGAALAGLLQDPQLCAHMGTAGRSAARRFDWEALAARQERIYREAVSPRPQGSSAIGSALADVARRLGRRPRVLLFGNYGNGNLGDEAILARLAELAADSCDVTVVARNPDAVRALHGLPAVATTSRAGRRAFRRADVLAIGGGGIFGRGIPPLPRMLPVVALLGRLLGKQTCYLAIGAYDGTPRLVRRLLRLSARLSVFVTVRDRESARTLSAPGVDPVLVRDPAVDLRPLPAEAADALLRAAGVTGGAPLALSLKPTPDPELTERAVTAAAAAVDWWCAHRSSDVVFLALSRRGDYGLGESVCDAALAEQLTARVRHPERLHVIGPDLHPAALKAVVGRAAAVVALRLHAQIFAVSMGRPLLGLSFERKSEAFLTEAGAERRWLADLTGGQLVEWLEAL